MIGIVRNYYVYRFKNRDNQIIYVGQTRQRLSQRLNGHNHLPDECYNETENIEYITLKSQDDMDIAERYFISKWKPKYNKIMINKEINLQIVELESVVWVNNNTPEVQLLLDDSTIDDEMVSLTHDLEIVKAKKEFAFDVFKYFNGKHIETISCDDDDPIRICNEGNYKVVSEMQYALLKEEKRIEDRIRKLKVDEIKRSVGVAVFNNLPKWKQEMYIEYGVRSDKELIELKIDELKISILNSALKRFIEHGYINIPELLNAISEEFRTAYNSNDVGVKSWLNLFFADNYERSNLMVKEARDAYMQDIFNFVIQEIQRKIGCTLNKEIISVFEHYVGWSIADALKVEQPLLVYKAS